MFKREKDTTSRVGGENTIEKFSVLWTCEEVIQIIRRIKFWFQTFSTIVLIFCIIKLKFSIFNTLKSFISSTYAL